MGGYGLEKCTAATVTDSGEMRGMHPHPPAYRVSTPTRAVLRRCRWPRPRHAARLIALARSDDVTIKRTITAVSECLPPTLAVDLDL